MRYGHPPQDGAWSKSGAVIAVAAMAAAASAWAVALRPVRFSTPALALAWLIAVGGVCVIARGRMPAPVKAVLLAGVCGSLLTCFATQDVLGLRRVEAQTGSALAEANVAVVPRRPANLAVTVTGDSPAADAIATSLAAGAGERLAGSDIGLSARVTITANGAHRLNWTLTRGEHRQWCGVITDAPGTARPAFADFSETLATAARHSRGGPLGCE